MYYSVNDFFWKLRTEYFDFNLYETKHASTFSAYYRNYIYIPFDCRKYVADFIITEGEI